MTPEQRELITRCKQSCVFFLRNFAKTKHPAAGLIPFRPHDYQIRAIKAFRDHKYVIFRKCRQVGISKIAGAFALWFGMFNNDKTILIVSRSDADAMEFLNNNVRLLFRNIPKWMQDIWEPKNIKDNEHEMRFPNGSVIRSLTSHPEVLRSNASSLNIIDESAFIQNMSQMWTAGQPTLIHGGRVICISTVNGVGDWYWNTWTDAESGANDFYPLVINWWDMTWKIEYRDPMTNKLSIIAPTEGIRKCETPEEIQKYGPYWSPWLEQEYRSLQEKGESWRFRQEILAEFVGSGNTVIPTHILSAIERTINRDYKRVIGTQPYQHPVTQTHMTVDFSDNRHLEEDEGLWVWEPPNRGKPPVLQGKRIVEAGESAHRYVAGVDLATGKGRDYSAIVVFDTDTRRQVAELMIRATPRVFKFLLDYVGRWYNNALLVIERNNGGDAFIEEMRHEFMYPNLWRKREINDRPTSTNRGRAMILKDYGFYTSPASKPVLNKALIDYIREDETGYVIVSRRLLKQLFIYVRKRDRSGRDTTITEAEDGPGNHDDLVMACGMAFIGIPDAILSDQGMIMPYASHTSGSPSMSVPENPEAVYHQLQNKLENAHPSLVVPMRGAMSNNHDDTVQAELMKFAQQLGSIPTVKPTSAKRRY